MRVDRNPLILSGHFFPSYDVSGQEGQSLLKRAEKKKPKVVLGMTEEGARRESIERQEIARASALEHTS